MHQYISIFKSLNDDKVKYVLIGGLALVLHGHRRTTGDIDILISLKREEAEKAIKTLTRLGMKATIPVDPMQFADERIRESWLQEKGMKAFSMHDPSNPMLGVDIMVREFIPYAELASRAKKYNIGGGVMINLCSLADLLTLKKIANRAKDQEDIDMLKKLHEE